MSFKKYYVIYEHKETIEKFITFCNKALELNDTCKIKLVDKPEEGMTTGCYNPVDQEIKVLNGNRALVDVLRSLAHELVHAKQDQELRLHPGDGDDGSPIENEAHALAGLLMRKFQKNNRHIYEM